MTTVPLRHPDSPWPARWSVLQLVAILATVALLAGMIVQPDFSLRLLWYVAIPILPATFFVNTAIWRNICPLATLNAWGNKIGRQRTLSQSVAGLLGIGGLVLFHLMVPARRFLFNSDGTALAVTVAAVGLLAVWLGAVYAVRSAFCNALCPVLPVELLYGQAPLADMARGRCATCTTCTPRGCLDLAQARALPQIFGRHRQSMAWLAEPRGIFMAALPGFIVGYSLLQDGSLRTAPLVYATTLGWSLASVLIVVALTRAFRLRSEAVLVLLAAAAGLLYYWFAGPAIATAFAARESLALAVRVAGMGLVTYWLIRAWRSLPSISSPT